MTTLEKRQTKNPGPGQPYVQYVHVYVTRSGKRYHSAQKFKIALAVPLESAERKLYDDVNPAFVARSYHVL